MVHEQGEVVVRDLGSTNGIRINGQRVEMGRLKSGDELSIAHIRYRLDNGQGHERTLVDPEGPASAEADDDGSVAVHPIAPSMGNENENVLAAAVRKVLPSAVADKCRIQVIVQMTGEKESHAAFPVLAADSHVAEKPPA
jgi:hypothetical protein